MRKLHLFALLCVLTSTSAFAINGDMGIGTGPNTDGSETYPYLIEDVNDFDTFADPANAATYWAAGVHTKLMTDIDLSGRTYTTAVIAPDTHNSNHDFDGNAFTGVFDGNGFKILGLAINDSVGLNDYLGLFGYIGFEGEVSGLGIEDCNITGDDNYTTALVAYNFGSIINCYSTGEVTSNYLEVGGLVGRNFGNIIQCYSTVEVKGQLSGGGGLVGGNDGSITDCYSTGTVGSWTFAMFAGGLVGWNYGTITNSYSTGAVIGDSYLGGMAGGNVGSITSSYSNGMVTSTSEHAGGLTSYNEGSITNCHAIGAVTGTTKVGGLCGYNFNGSTITNCYATGTVNGENYVGGLCGYNDYSSDIENCYATGTVSGTENIGGLCGFNDGKCTITDSYATGTVTATVNSVGGVCGYNEGTISNCYSTGNIRGIENVGGLCGYNTINLSSISYATITNCYANGLVSGTNYVGGLLGLNYYGTITDNFWDVESSGITVAYTAKTGNGSSTPYVYTPVYSTLGIAEGKTTAEMQMESTFVGWDFSTPVWMMLRPGEDYPRLAWQETFRGDIAGLYGVDMVDFAYLSKYWGQDCDSPECDRADADDSGTIDLPDLAAVAADWLK